MTSDPAEPDRPTGTARLVLTEANRVGLAPLRLGPASAAPPSPDLARRIAALEAAIAAAPPPQPRDDPPRPEHPGPEDPDPEATVPEEVLRRILREELPGIVAAELERTLPPLVRREVSRALAARRRD